MIARLTIMMMTTLTDDLEEKIIGQVLIDSSSTSSHHVYFISVCSTPHFTNTSVYSYFSDTEIGHTFFGVKQHALRPIPSTLKREIF
jgi:hypothetical protein